jgi:hypothetical protein
VRECDATESSTQEQTFARDAGGKTMAGPIFTGPIFPLTISYMSFSIKGLMPQDCFRAGSGL